MDMIHIHGALNVLFFDSPIVPVVKAVGKPDSLENYRPITQMTIQAAGRDSAEQAGTVCADIRQQLTIINVSK